MLHGAGVFRPQLRQASMYPSAPTSSNFLASAARSVSSGSMQSGPAERPTAQRPNSVRNAQAPQALPAATAPRGTHGSSFRLSLNAPNPPKPKLAYDAPNFETLMSVRAPQTLCGFAAMRDPRNPGFVNLMSMRAPEHLSQTGDKFHLNLAAGDLGKGYLAVSDLLFAENSPFHEWKIADLTITGSQGRVGSGAQITLYADTPPPLCPRRLAAIEVFLCAIEKNLSDAGIGKGARPSSDVAVPGSSFISYRNDQRSERFGDGSANEREPFFIALSDEIMRGHS